MNPGWQRSTLALAAAGAAGAAAAAVLIGQEPPAVRRFALAAAFSAAFVQLAWIDWRTGLLPDRITLPGSAFALFADPLWPGRDPWSSALALLVLGGIAAAAWFCWSDRYFGLGDVKMAAMAGGAVGVAGVWPLLLLAMLTSTAWGLALMTFRGAGRKHLVRLGPFIAAGAVVSVWTTT